MQNGQILHRKKINPWLVAFFAIWVSLAIVFAFTDLYISQAIYHPESVWAGWMQTYGQTPAILACFFGTSVLLRLRDRQRSIKNFLYGFLIFTVVMILAVMTWINWLSQVNGGFLLSIPLGGLCLWGVQVWLDKYPEAALEKFKPAGRVALWLFLLSPGLTSLGIKFVWGRWSYSEILPNLTRFSPWYLPQGPDGHVSFPSGHTSLAFMFLPITMLVPKNKPSYYMVWGLILCWGIFMAITRVVLGVHFASDTLFGGCQVILWFYIVRSHLDRT
jgi:membrane-associated phospholipid phosphatase